MGMGMSLWEYGFKNMVWLEAEGASIHLQKKYNNKLYIVLRKAFNRNLSD